MEKDNPARRLLIILQKSKTMGTNANTKMTWFSLLEVPNANEPLLFSKLGKLMTLPNIILEDVRKYHPKHVSVCEKAVVKINHALYNQNLSGQWTSFVQHISDEIINYIELFSSLLDYEYKMNILEKDQLDEIRNAVDELIKEVVGMDLDAGFKMHLLKYLKKIVNSIDEYNIMGIDPILESLETTAGHAILNKEFGENLHDANLSDKFINIFEKLTTLVNSGNSYYQLGTNIINMLPK